MRLMARRQAVTGLSIPASLTARKGAAPRPFQMGYLPAPIGFATAAPSFTALRP